MKTYTVKTGIECSVLMRAVDQCQGNVRLKTSRGDVIDLKSELSRFAFVSAFGNANLMFAATLELTDLCDYTHIAKCVIPEEGK